MLVLDEATSALDNATERAVMDAIDGLGRDLTILIVAHRITTLGGCDQIVELSGGQLRSVSGGPTLPALQQAWPAPQAAY